MTTIKKYDQSQSLKDKILYVLSVMDKASQNEVASEIMELDGISTEEGVADISVDVENVLDKLCDEGLITKLKEHRQKVRYVLNTHS